MKMKLNQVKLIHNGMNITWHDSEEDALNYIHNYIAESNARVKCYPFMDKVIKGFKDPIDNCDSVRVIMYQYYTHYMEVFVLKNV